MSDSPETDLDLDLHFLPAWAQKTADPDRYAKYAGETAPDPRRQDRFDRRPRPRSGPPSRQPDRGQGQGRGQGPRRTDDHRRSDNRSRRDAPTPAPLPELDVAFKPDDHGIESLARQIKMTGRAYPLFDIAQMVLQKPERHSLTISVIKKAEGKIVQPLVVCALDDTLWLSEQEAVNYVLDKHFATFYQPERTQVDPPKGTYTFVAQCGMSGAVLGPPNYHDYQNQLRKLHNERFARMPFEAFKSRVKIVKDEAVVKKWIEEQSWKTEYLCLNLPEPLKLGTRGEVEAHFRATHLPNIIRPVESFSLTGPAARNLRCAALARLVRVAWEDQKRFPLQIATVLSQQFASHGLQFFKVNRTVTHVAIARPHFLDLDAAPVSEGVKRIVQLINATPKCTRRILIDIIAPTPARAAVPIAPVEGVAQPTVPAEAPEPSPEANAAAADLHWLIHQGHVIEFANGVLETAKKPIIKPPKPIAPPAAPSEASAAKAEIAPGQSAVPTPAVEPAAAAEAAPITAEPAAAPTQTPEPDAAVPAAPEASA